MTPKNGSAANRKDGQLFQYLHEKSSEAAFPTAFAAGHLGIFRWSPELHRVSGNLFVCLSELWTSPILDAVLRTSDLSQLSALLDIILEWQKHQMQMVSVTSCMSIVNLTNFML